MGETAHESPRIAVRSILAIGGVIAVGALTMVAVIYFILGPLAMPRHSQSVARRGVIPPSPRLQAHPQRDLAEMRAPDNALLSTWGWVEPTHEFARVPIARAMALYVERHSAPDSHPVPRTGSP